MKKKNIYVSPVLSNCNFQVGDAQRLKTGIGQSWIEFLFRDASLCDTHLTLEVCGRAMKNETRINVTQCELPERVVFDRYIDQVFASAWLTNGGQHLRNLEQRLEEYLDVNNVVIVASATTALQIAYRVLGLSGEIITTPFSFVSTASSIRWQGLQPVFADIDARTLNIDPASIRESVNEHTSAIVPVHVYGNPCAVEEIQGVADDHGLKVIYDAAHCFGVQLKGKSILGLGDISILSLHATKLFHTAEGGALVFRDRELAQKARTIANCGIGETGSITQLGTNAKLTELGAAMGLSLLPQMDSIIAARAERTYQYDVLLGDTVKRPVRRSDATRNHSYYPVIFEDEAQCCAVQRELNELNIYPRRYFYPALSDLDFLGSRGATPNAHNAASRVLCLPLYSKLQASDCERIALAVRRVVVN